MADPFGWPSILLSSIGVSVSRDDDSGGADRGGSADDYSDAAFRGEVPLPPGVMAAAAAEAEAKAERLARMASEHALQLSALRASWLATQQRSSVPVPPMPMPPAPMVAPPWQPSGGGACSTDGSPSVGTALSPTTPGSQESGKNAGRRVSWGDDHQDVPLGDSPADEVEDDEGADPRQRNSRSPHPSRPKLDRLKKMPTGNVCLNPTVLPLWQGANGIKIASQMSPLVSDKPLESSLFKQGRAGDAVVDNSCIQGFILPPTSGARICWDLFSLLVMLYDMTTLPLVVFNYDERDLARRINVVTSAFWALDIVFNFFVGFHRKDGRIEMRIREIARQYGRTWLLPDVLIVSVDVVLMIIDSGASDAVSLTRIGKTARAVRITRCVRMFRLVRVVKLVQVFEQLCDFVFSAGVATLLNILRLLVGLAFIVHFIACSYYAIGKLGETDERGSWVQELEEEGASQTFCYVIAYHWSMAQFTPAPSNYHPKNFQERIFAVCVLFVGLVLFSSLLGTTTALLNQSRQRAYAQFRETDMIRRFLTDNQVSLVLGNKIMHFLKGDNKKQKRVSETDVPMLKSLPFSLQLEMHYELHMPVMSSCAILGMLDTMQMAATSDICHVAVAEASYSKGEEPFNYRMIGTSMIFLYTGTLEYYPGMATLFGAHMGGCVTHLKAGDQLSEPVLWMHWEHRGLLQASGQCHVVKVLADNFRLAVQRHDLAFEFLQEYVSVYAHKLQEVVMNDGEVDDTFIAFKNEEELHDAFKEHAKTLPVRLRSLTQASQGASRTTMVDRWAQGIADAAESMADAVGDAVSAVTTGRSRPSLTLQSSPPLPLPSSSSG